MKNIELMSVHEAFDWVMDHYYPAGLEELAQLTDGYAIISIQDSHTQGFGVRFCESSTCKGALTLLFDDVADLGPAVGVARRAGAVEFTDSMARQIIDFIVNVKKNFHLYGKKFCPDLGKKIFRLHGKHFFQEVGKEFFHVPGKKFYPALNFYDAENISGCLSR